MNEDLTPAQRANVAESECISLRSQLASLTEKIAVLSTAIEQMICPSPRVLHSDAIGRKALTSTAPILDRIKNEAKAEAFEKAADYIRKVRCGKKADTDLFNASSEFEIRAAALREAK